MEQYIDKAAVVAEIVKQQRRLCILGQSNEVELRKKVAIQNGVYCSLLSFLDTLEVEEVTSIELLKVKGFLVTDKDDYTAIYSTKPNRGRTEWVDGNHPRNANESSCLMTLNNARLLPDIEFNDKPIEVEVVIKAQKG